MRRVHEDYLDKMSELSIVTHGPNTSISLEMFSHSSEGSGFDEQRMEAMVATLLDEDEQYKVKSNLNSDPKILWEAHDVPSPVCDGTFPKLQTPLEPRGMPITLVNRQRIYGPPDGETTVPSKGSEVFVGKLPRDCIETEIVPVFETVGRIYELRIMMGCDSFTNRGYCFVQFYTPEEATRAVKELNQYKIRKGHSIGVTKSVDNKCLYIGGIPKYKSEDSIFKEINKITDGVIRVIVYLSIEDRAKNRGFAFVEYETQKSAAMARIKMMSGKIQLWGVDVFVNWAEVEPYVDNEVMKKVKALHVRNLCISTTEATICYIFNQVVANSVERVRKIKDYAFVHFVSRETAEKAKESLDRTEIDGSRVEIMWAKPADKKAYKAEKDFARALYSPNRFSNGYLNQSTGFNNNNINSFNPYPGNSRMMQNQYHGYPIVGENRGGVISAQQFRGISRELEAQGFQNYPQYGENVGFQNAPFFMTDPVQLPPPNFDASLLEPFQRMRLQNRSVRGHEAGGIQYM